LLNPFDIIRPYTTLFQPLAVGSPAVIPLAKPALKLPCANPLPGRLLLKPDGHL
jgi:hypothetical protein